MTFSNHIKGLGRVALILSATTAAVYAQEAGQINGTVRSDKGGAIAGATIIIKAPQMIAPRTLSTGADGSFRAPLLPVGDYTITVEAPGYLSKGAKGVRIGIGGRVTQDFVLKTAQQASAVVEVVATSSTADKADTKTATNVSAESLASLPLADRAFYGAADVAPGVVTTGTGSVAIRGGYTQSTVYTVNGVSVGDDYQGQQYSNRVIDDAIEDAQVVQSPLHARFGRTSSGSINVVTKSGGNDFAGSIRGYYTRADWNAKRPKARETGPDQINEINTKQYDVFVSGPIVKDKLWFALQTIITPETATSGTYANGDNPANWAVSAYDNPGNMAYLGLPEVPYTYHQGENYSGTSKFDFYDAKLTWAINNDHTLEGQYFYQMIKSHNVDIYGTENMLGPRALMNQNDTSNTAQVTYKGAWASNVFVEARYSSLGTKSELMQQFPDEHVFVNYGTANSNYAYGPGYGGPLPDRRDSQSGNLNIKVFADLKGSHELDFGVDYYEFDRQTFFRTGENNRMWFGQWVTPGAVAMSDSGMYLHPIQNGTLGLDPYGVQLGFLAMTTRDASFWDTGSSRVANISFNGPAPSYRAYYGTDGKTKNRNYAIYANDNWNINAHWTVMAGLRMDRMKVQDTTGEIIMRHNTPVSPRIKVVFDLTGDSSRVFTATAAKFFDDFRGGFTNAFVLNARSISAFYGWSALGGTGTNLEGAANGFESPYGFVDYAQLTNPANYGGYYGGYAIDPTNRLAPQSQTNTGFTRQGLSTLTAPYTLEYTLGFRRNYKDGSYVSVNAVHKNWKNQYSIEQRLDLDSVKIMPDVIGTGAQQQAIFTYYGNSDRLKRIYNAFELEFNNRISSVWNLGGSYTYSRLTGNDQGGDSTTQGFRSNVASSGFLYNDWLTGAQRQTQTGIRAYTQNEISPDGALSSDQTHKARLSLAARLPLGKGFISYAWTLKYDSGSAFSAIMANSTYAGSGTGNWNAGPGGAALPGVNTAPYSSTFSRFYNGRGTYRLPDTYTVDFKVSFELPLVAKLRLLGAVTVGNFFNHQLQSNINGTFTATTLGRNAMPGVSNTALFGTDNNNYATYIPARSVGATVGLKF